MNTDSVLIISGMIRAPERGTMLCPACKDKVDIVITKWNKCYPCPHCHRMIHKAMWIQFNESATQPPLTPDPLH